MRREHYPCSTHSRALQHAAQRCCDSPVFLSTTAFRKTDFPEALRPALRRQRVVCAACLRQSAAGGFVRVDPFDPPDEMVIAPICRQCSKLPDIDVTQQVVRRLYRWVEILDSAASA